MNIACIGNIVHDATAYFGVDIVLGGKNSSGDVKHTIGGPASTAASVIAKGDHHVDFYGQVGMDEIGVGAIKEMTDEKINMDNVYKDPEDFTPNSFIAVDPKGDRTIFSMSSQNNHGFAIIKKFNIQKVYDYILTDGKYGPQSVELIKKNKLANPNAISIIDAGRWNAGVLEVCRHVDYIICSEEFANNVTGCTINYEKDNMTNILGLLEDKFPNAKGITITVGERGYICRKNGEVVLVPAYRPKEPTIDTNGAGDIFHGAFTHALASGLDYYDSLEFAKITAAISTTAYGGRKSCPDLSVVQEIFMKQKELEAKYIPQIIEPPKKEDQQTLVRKPKNFPKK